MAVDDASPKAISQKYLTYILSAIKSFVPTNISELTNDKNYVTSNTLTTDLATKQNTLTFDTIPTAGSTNPVTSDGIKTALSSATVTKLANARTISLSGNATGSASFDGSNDITISTTVTQANTALNVPTSDVGGNIWIS